MLMSNSAPLEQINRHLCENLRLSAGAEDVIACSWRENDHEIVRMWRHAEPINLAQFQPEKNKYQQREPTIHVKFSTF